MNYTLISNPPYNMKWIAPPFAQIQPRFNNCEVPPESNANYAFVLTALEKSDRCVFILPCSVLQGGLKQEKEIRKYLIDRNLVEAVIICPDNMFETTSITTCILILDKNKQTTTIEMIDMREKFEIEIREQNGQYGGDSHTKRTYRKELKTFTDELMQEAILCIKERKSIEGYCKCVNIETVKVDKYSLLASHYLDIPEQKNIHREYSEIVADINRIVREKNTCKLTINETLAKSIGFDLELYKTDHLDNEESDKLLLKLGAEKLLKHNYFTATKNKNEIKFENKDKEQLSSILIMILQTWKQHIYYLNQEENRYLAELRDALLPDLISGKIDLN